MLNDSNYKENIEVPAATSPTVDNDIVDISLDTIKKKKFRIDGDNNRILELNTSDLSVVNRIEDSYPKLVELERKASSLKVNNDNPNDESLDDAVERSNLSQTLREIDQEMRGIVDYIFDSNVSEVCAPFGSMFDPINGEFRYEHIIDALTKLYENNFNSEFDLMRKRVQKHTNKYTGRR